MADMYSCDNLLKEKDSQGGSSSLHSSEDNGGHQSKEEDTLPPNDLDSDIENKQESNDFPEGGWGWVIVAASFFNSFIFDGIGSCYGVLYPYVLDQFKASAFVTSFPGSIFGAYLITGSFAAILIKRFGFRVVSFTGGLVSCLAFVAASYSPNIYLFLLSFGVVGGASIGLVYLSSMVIVNGYFNKKRGITNGIISSGSGMGLLVLAPLINSLLDEYSLHGTILILAGILLNICVFSTLFRQPKVYSSKSNSIEDDGQSYGDSSCSADEDTEESTVGSSSMEHIINFNEVNGTEEEKSQFLLTDPDVSQLEPPTALVFSYIDHKGHGINRALKQDQVFGKSDNFLCKRLQSDFALSNKLQSVDNLWKRPQHSYLSMQSVFRKLTDNDHRRSHLPSSVLLDIGTNSYPTGSISRLMHFHRENFTSSRQLQVAPSLSALKTQGKENNLDTEDLVNCSISEIDIEVPQRKNHLTSQSSLHENFSTTNFDQEPLGYSIRELLKMPLFYLFCSGACLIQFGFPIPNIFLADLAASYGIPSHQSAMMISLIGSFNIGGRLLAGFLGNTNVNPIRLNNAALLLASILCFLSPLFTNVWSLSLFAALYGFLLVPRKAKQDKHQSLRQDGCNCRQRCVGFGNYLCTKSSKEFLQVLMSLYSFC